MAASYERKLTVGDGERTVRIYCADMTKARSRYDVAVCSAYRDDYFPVRGTLIGALHEHMGIDVAALARDPAIDLRAQGGWVSEPLDGAFGRIVCVELRNAYKDEDVSLRRSFSTLCYLLEQIDCETLGIEKIALPVLGAGNQGLALDYVVPPLLHGVWRIFERTDIREIDFYERDEHKAARLVEAVDDLLTRFTVPKVFISYNHCQTETAHALAEKLQAAGILCWIAPESIAAGDDYPTEIRQAIYNAVALVVVLTPESERSAWVKKEVDSALGSEITVIPCTPPGFKPSNEFGAELLGTRQRVVLTSIDDENLDALIRSLQSEKRMRALRRRITDR